MNKHFTRLFVILMIFTAVALTFCFDAGGTAVTNAEKADYVYLGGKPVGVELGPDGVFVVGTGGVVTDKGLIYPLNGKDVRHGDILMSVGGISVQTPSDISAALKKIHTKSVVIKLKRGDNTYEIKVETAKDTLTSEKRLGISVSDNVTGVGTLTFIKENGNFGALGHNVAANTEIRGHLSTGTIFNCEITGVVPAEPNRAGELQGSFNRYSDGIGNVTKINDFGLYGEYTADYTAFRKILTASRDEIKHGEAFIYTCIEGDEADYYSIDIIKTYSQTTPATKSMVISVTDKRLIKSTGGIVQGMSGSPVIQNGKLIGAVTHVFVGDATKGYAVYVDWMLQN